MRVWNSSFLLSLQFKKQRLSPPKAWFGVAEASFTKAAHSFGNTANPTPTPARALSARAHHLHTVRSLPALTLLHLLFHRHMSAAATTPARGEEDEPVSDNLLCSRCSDAPPNHAYHCRNGHLLCRGCLDALRSRARRARQHPKCPTCRITLPDKLNRNRAVEQTIALLPATCRHCAKETTRGALVPHESSCPASAPDATAPVVELRRVHLLHLLVVLVVVVVGALVGTTTSAQAGKNEALLLTAANDKLAGRLIAGGAKVDAARASDGYDGLTPLCIACAHGNVIMVQRLIAAGSRVNDASTDGDTPLFFAARYNRLDVLKLLIAAGADVNKACVNDGCTPLHIAAQDGHAGVVSVLLETAGVDMNLAALMTTDGEFAGITYTPSFIAAWNNRLDVVTLLIAARSDVSMACVDGYTPLHIAAHKGYTGVVSVLLETAGVDMNAALTDGRDAGVTPLFLAAEDNRLDVLKLLIAAGADVNMARADGYTPLHMAAQNGHAGVVSALLEAAGVDLNKAPADGATAGVTPLYIAPLLNQLDFVKMLITAGAGVDMACADGDAPLHVAAHQEHDDVVDLLIAAGANLHATLSFALARGHAVVAQKLRAAGANEYDDEYDDEYDESDDSE
jgi:ankyrin repeat protein